MVNTRDQSTEEKILVAARKVFLNKGMDGARMQDIADAAGINKALLHYYFRSKDKLFEQIFMEVASSMLPRIFTIFQSDDPLFVKIDRFCNTYITQLIKTPYVPIFILNEINRQPQAFLKNVLGNTRPPVEKLLLQIEQETRAGIIKPVNPIQLLLNALSLCIFPFLASPMIQLMPGMDAKNFKALMEERKKLVPQLIIESIKK
ncbi:MAG TPA: TetR/AcrR family transcriptional regulator [Flavisolibacter sp.]|nr:TetR/AcrR family transcriptional regulator [Flavisolibacter sp.]